MKAMRIVIIILVSIMGLSFLQFRVLSGFSLLSLDTTAGLSPEPHSTAASIALVPLDPFHACDNRVLHLSCLHTIIMEDHAGSIPSAPELVPNVCSDLPRKANEAHVILCLQTPDSLGVLIRKNKEGFSYLFPSETKSLPLPSFRIVDRKTVAMSGFYPPRSPENDVIRGRDDNAGNFLWQYAATRMINPATTLILRDNLQLNVAEKSTTVHPSAYIIASANALNLKTDGLLAGLINAYRNSIKAYRVPTVILGIGIQAEFNSVEQAKSFQLFDYQREFLKSLVQWQAAPAIGVRGSITQMTCQNSGFDNCVSTGCPTLLISRESNLGNTLKNKWKQVQKRLESNEMIKVAIALPAIAKTRYKEFKMVMDLLLGIHEKHDAIFVLQMPYDRLTLSTFLKNRTSVKAVVTKKYNNSEEWIEDLSKVDLVVSTRIHGGMAGIAAGTPTVVIPTDFRILELVDAMMVPHLTMEQIAKEKVGNVGSILKHANYQDFKAFERNRRDKIRQWQEILDQVGLEMEPSLLRTLDSPL